MARGTCTLHAFNEGPDDEGEPRMRRSVDALLRPNPEKIASASITIVHTTRKSCRAAVKVATSSTLRLSARISQSHSSCICGSINTCRASRRHYGTVATTTDTHKSRENPSPASTTHQSPRRPWPNPKQVEPPVKKTRSTPRFYVPSILLPREAAAASPTVHKIHILGEDERSKFIAHALSCVYDSVEMIGWRSQISSKYGNIQRSRPQSPRASPNVEANLASPRTPAQRDSCRIDTLVVTGHGHQAVEALEAVKHRIDKNTTVCLMNDGLGVLEDVQRRVFQGIDEFAPDFLLGHMNHRLAFNRTYDAVTQLKLGQTRITSTSNPRMSVKDMRKVGTRPNFISALEEARDLRFSFHHFDHWLRFKLPSVIFDSVVEPICVLFEMPYQGLLQNTPAQRVMHGLLSEIILVLQNMPELKDSTVIRDYVYSKDIRKFMYSRITAKRTQPSRLKQQIERGLPTDVDYLNGYFCRRGRKLGLDMRMNLMMRDMVKSKHSLAVERLNSFVPLEETSIPSDLGFRYRTLPT
ncbi:hypothetical protein E4U21_000836 [Claviceps maximensis]|nr:hypothetical protein E4U21_000836 [Claviceps maximensis]